MEPPGGINLNNKIVQLLDSNREAIQKAWFDLLKESWADSEEKKQAALRTEQDENKDLLFALIQVFSGASEPFAMSTTFLERIRLRSYSISDFFLEVSCLKDAIVEVLGSCENLNLVELQHIQKKLNHFAKKILHETADIYEYSLEQGGRGFCQTSKDGKILYANLEMARILSAERPLGEKLTSFFVGEDADFIQRMLSAPDGTPPGMRPMELTRSDGSRIPVGVEVGSVYVEKAFQGGYAAIVNLERAFQAQQMLFEKSDLGIVQVSREKCFKFVNPSAQKMLGLQVWHDQPIKNLFPDDDAWKKMESHLEKRYSNGLAEEYETDLTRQKDGRKITVKVLGIPEADLNGNIIGSTAIIRNLTEEKFGERLHQGIAASEKAKQLFTILEKEIGNQIPYDFLTFALFDSKTNEVRIQYADSPDKTLKWDIRWWKVPSNLASEMASSTFEYIPDLKQMLEDLGLPELTENRHMRRLINQDLRSICTIRLILNNKVLSSLNIMRKGKDSFSEEECNFLEKSLPLQQALMVLHHRVKLRKTQFRHGVMNNIIQVCKEEEALKLIAGVITESLVENYEWENVSIFEAGEKIRLLSQKAKDNNENLLLGDDYEQGLGEGILGDIQERGVPEYIPDVTRDKRYKVGYKKTVLSECCIPIRVDSRLNWLLNVEDSRENAFSETEFEELKDFVGELKVILDRVSLHHFLEAVLDSAYDSIVVTDRRGNILQVNHAAIELLDSEEENLKRSSIGDFLFFEDPSYGLEWVLDKGTPPLEGVFILLPEREKSPVLLSSAPISGEGGFVFILRNLTYEKKVEELEFLGQMYNEIAVQTKIPLSLASSWLRKLAKKSMETPVRDTLEKTMKQLRKVELTYDRLALYEQKKAFDFKKVLFDLADVIAQVVAEFPIFETEKIEWSKEPNLWVRGHSWQLSFCIRSLLSYLIRLVSEEDKVLLNAASSEGKVFLKIEGMLPHLPEKAEANLEKVSRIEEILLEMALGDSAIKTIIQGHDGDYESFRREDGCTSFHITLPSAGEK